MTFESNTNTNTSETFTSSAGGANHNILADCAATIVERFESAKAASRASLESLRIVGDRLNDAKDILAQEKGAFGAWCEAFPFDKTWRARLMKLAANWDAIMEAVDALPVTEKKSWSVDGVLAIWAKAQKAAASGGEGGEGEGSGEGGEGAAPKETKAQRLERELAEALARIAALEELLEKTAKAQAKQEKAKAKAEAPKEEPKAKPSGTVDAATVKRATKVWALFTKGGTEGEKSAAEGRLQAMADKLSMSFADFVAACGLSH